MCESTNVEKLCRLCGSESGIKINIFEPDAEHVKKIHKLLPITVNEHDPLPKHMCHRCTFKINEFYDFRTICLKTQESLKSKIPWLQSNTNGSEAVFVDDPMVQLNVNPLNIPLVEAKENFKNDHLGIQEDCQQVLEPEIVTYTMPSYIGGVNAYQNNNRNISENQKILVSPKNQNRRERRPGPNNKLSKIWKTKRRKRRAKKRKPIRRVNSRKGRDLLFTPVDTSTEILRVLDIQSNNTEERSMPYTDEHSKLYTNEQYDDNVYPANENGETSNDFSGMVESRRNELPPNILVTNIPRVGFVYTCENCARTFLASDSASRHLCDTVPVEIDDDMHTEIQNVESPINAVKEFCCEVCGRLFRKLEHLQAHSEEHYQPTEYRCDICDKKFKREAQYNTHIQQHFNNDSPPNYHDSADSLSSWYSE